MIQYRIVIHAYEQSTILCGTSDKEKQTHIPHSAQIAMEKGPVCECVCVEGAFK